MREQKKLKKSEESYKKAIELNPNFADAYNNLGVTQRELNKFVEAEYIATKKAIELNSNFANAYNNLGIILREQKKLKESEEVTKKQLN